MKKRMTVLATSALLLGSVAAVLSANPPAGQVSARPAGDATQTPAAPSDTPGFGDSATQTPTPTATVGAASPVASPTAGTHKQAGSPKPIVVEVSTKIEGQGLKQKDAFLLANRYIPQFLIVAPVYVPKGFSLQWIHVDPPQDQQTPPAAWLQYVKQDQQKAKGRYPSFQIDKRLGVTPLVNPGGKVQTVQITTGVKGAGAIKGVLVDLKPKHGDETIYISWNRITIGYQVSSDVTQSKLSAKELLAVAASVQ